MRATTGLVLALVFGCLCHHVKAANSRRFLLRTEPCHCEQDCHCEQGNCVSNKCQCNPGWGGTDCAIQAYLVPKTTSATTTTTASGTAVHVQPSVNHNDCRGHYNGTHCVCSRGWTGERCQYAPSTKHECVDSSCINGICLWWLDYQGTRHQYCHCDADYRGNHCTYSSNSGGHDYRCADQSLCEHGTCMHNTLYRPEDYHFCECQGGWHGDRCDENHTDTETIICDHKVCRHGTCGRYYDRYTRQYYERCKCETGWAGEHCDREESKSCGNYLHCLHGDCLSQYDPWKGHNIYHCSCTGDWHGVSCDQRATAFPSTTTSTTTTSSSTTSLLTSPETSPMTTPDASTTTQTTPLKLIFTATTAPTTGLLFTAAPTVQSKTTSTTSVPVTTPTHTYTVCDETDVMASVNNSVHSIEPTAHKCASGQHQTSEAFVLSHCQVDLDPSAWLRDNNVAQLCNGSSSPPAYTPIATFDHGVYSSAGGRAGIFLECTSNGFKMAFQTCSHAPHISSIEYGGAFIQDPTLYYILQ